MKRLAILASGGGTNAEAIINYFKGREDVSIEVVMSNKPEAYVLQRAKNHGISQVVFQKQELESGKVLETLKKSRIDLVVLAGFLLLIPEQIVEAFPDRILNIHPALLPNYGGKGMYGDRVHEAVIKNGETESGITIHFVNNNYDEGSIIKQVRCPVNKDDSPESLATRIHTLEYANYPSTIDKILSKL